MASNKTKIDRIHDQMPRFFKTRTNKNWKALIEALGESDEDLSELVQQVKKQLFIKTAGRPYLDRLGSNFKVSRPRFLGMDDETFRRYIPVVAYQPKQVKLVLDQLLDIFFFRESTTAFTVSGAGAPYRLLDGWELEYTVDGDKLENIIFESDDFTDINNATAEEIAGVINRNARYSFAVVFDDRIRKKKFIRIFTNTVGSKGSIQVTGGRADIALQFTGFNTSAGSSLDTEWQVTKVGDTVTFEHVSGTSPRLDLISVGDVAIIELPGNEGSFVIESVDVAAGTFTFTNLFGTAGTFLHSNYPDSAVRFRTAEKMVVYTNRNRAVVWEVSPGEILVEIPSSPPVVKRRLEGSAHVNGLVDTVLNRVSDTELELENAEDWPINGGKFVFQPVEEIKSHILTDTEDQTTSTKFNTRYDSSKIFTYTEKVGNNLTGITPSLPQESSLFEYDIVSAQRDQDYNVTVTTASNHDFKVGNFVNINGTSSPLSTAGVRVDVESTDSLGDVGEKLVAALESTGDFTASNTGGIVTATNTQVGPALDAADVDSGTGVTVLQTGSAGTAEITQLSLSNGDAYDVAGNGLRFEISSANDETRYHFWFNVTDGTNAPQLNPGLDSGGIEGTYRVNEIVSPTEFKFISPGEPGIRTGGIASTERTLMANEGTQVYLTTAQLGTGILGPNIWDANSAYVLSSFTSKITTDIKAGNNVRTLPIEAVNNIPNQEGYVVFGFGTSNEEGPVRYFFKPTDSSLQLDPAYVFKNNHDSGSAITVIRRRGGHTISSTGKEYAPYITDPSLAREILEELIVQTKSVGIFIEFLVRYPEQLYATLDVYRSGAEDLYPVYQGELG